MSVRPMTRTLALLAVLGSGLLFVSASQANSNLLPNPGFELNCDGTPCDWLFGFWDTGYAHSGAASMQLSEDLPGSFNFSGVSSCVPATAGATYDFSVWYHTFESGLTQVGVGASYWSSTDCSTGILGNTGGALAAAIADGVWRQIAGAAQAPAGARSARADVTFGCALGCPLGIKGNFDDVVMDPAPPTAVTLVCLTATHTGSRVLLRWQTGTETRLAGFDVYRLTAAGAAQVNTHLIAAKAARSGRGAAYQLLDIEGRSTVGYRLQAVHIDGSRSWLGTVR